MDTSPQSPSSLCESAVAASDDNSDELQEDTSILSGLPTRQYRELSAEEWKMFKAAVPVDARVKPVEKDKPFVDAVLRKFTTGGTWSSVGKDDLPHKTIQTKYRRWKEDDGWSAALRKLFESRDLKVDIPDTTKQAFNNSIFNFLREHKNDKQLKALLCEIVGCSHHPQD